MEVPSPARWDEAFAGKVSRLCRDHYTERLKKTGKPAPGQGWTLMAAVVASVQVSDDDRPGT